MTPSGSQVGVFGRDLAAGPGRADHVVRGARRSGRGQVAAGLGRIHAVVADSGYHRAGSYWTRPDRGWLAELGLPAGHRGLPPETERLVDQAIREQLATYPGREVVGVSNLADGADQIFARAVLDAGGKLEVIVPAARYRDGLPESAHAAYDALLSRPAACTAWTGSNLTSKRTWRPAGPCWTGPTTCSRSGTASPLADTAAPPT
jgi:hypothetical protein